MNGEQEVSERVQRQQLEKRLRKASWWLRQTFRELAAGGSPEDLRPRIFELELEVRALERLLTKHTLAEYVLEPPDEETASGGSGGAWWERFSGS